MYIRRCIQTISIAILFFLVPALSQALTVTNLNNSGSGSLRDAVAGTAPGGTVDFDVTGTIVLSSEIVIDKDITIQGPGANQLTVSGGESTRIFNITAGTNIKINGVTISDGFDTNVVLGASAILVQTDSLNMELNDCVFENNVFFDDQINTAYGVINLLNNMNSPDFKLKVNRCSFINNLSQSVVENSFASGAVFSTFGQPITLEVYDSLFKGNIAEATAQARGGVASLGQFYKFSFHNCTFDSNVVRGKNGASGGVFGDGGIDNILNITNSTFYNNRVECTDNCSTIAGGAIGSFGASEISCSFCTFKSNRAVCLGNCVNIIGDTIAPSTIIRSTGGTTLSNSIVYGDNPENSCTTISGGNIISLGYNIDNGNTCVDGSVAGDKPFSNPGLSPAGLQDNGGPTPTIALFRNSPAIDMANPNCPPQSTDQRGVIRPQGNSCDIGAYELEEIIARPIPTLSEWGLIATAAALGLAGLLTVRRRRVNI